MSGLLVKLIVCPIAVYLSNRLFLGLSYAAAYQALIVGVILAVAAHSLELLLLNPGTFWVTNVIDFFAATILVYLVTLVLSGARITFAAAIYTALLVTLTEIPQHLWLIGRMAVRQGGPSGTAGPLGPNGPNGSAGPY